VTPKESPGEAICGWLAVSDGVVRLPREDLFCNASKMDCRADCVGCCSLELLLDSCLNSLNAVLNCSDKDERLDSSSATFDSTSENLETDPSSL
jgi:hypothetical protein